MRQLHKSDSDCECILQGQEVTLGQLYRAFWYFSSGVRARSVLAFCFMLLAQSVRLVIPYFTGNAVDAMQGTAIGVGFHQAIVDTGCIFGGGILVWLLHGPGQIIQRQVAACIRRRFVDTVCDRLVALPMDWHEATHSGDTIERLNKGAAALFDFSQNQFIYVQYVLSLIGSVVALLSLSIIAGSAALLGYLVVAAVLVRFDAGIIRLNSECNQAERNFSATLVDCLRNIYTVIALSLQTATRQMLRRRLEAIYDSVRRSIIVNEAKWCVVDLLSQFVQLFVVILYVWYAFNSRNRIMIGAVVMVFQYTQYTRGVVTSMATCYQDLSRYKTNFAGCTNLLPEQTSKVRSSGSIPENWNEIQVRSINFSYRRRQGRAAALKDVSLVLRRGERIALIGSSAAGKTTLLRLLGGIYSCDTLRIRVDGLERSDVINLSSIGTLVPQDPEIFDGSLEENITMGVNCSSAAVDRVCEICELSADVKTLAFGLKTPVGEGGTNLSGGQKQRLALCRALLRAQRSSLIMLDEPTSSLDRTTEERIFEHLHCAFPSACILSSVHRLYLLPHFNRIVLMDDGRIVDSGSFPELLKRQSAFLAIWGQYEDLPTVQQGALEPKSHETLPEACLSAGLLNEGKKRVRLRLQGTEDK